MEGRHSSSIIAPGYYHPRSDPVHMQRRGRHWALELKLDVRSFEFPANTVE